MRASAPSAFFIREYIAGIAPNRLRPFLIERVRVFDDTHSVSYCMVF